MRNLYVYLEALIIAIVLLLVNSAYVCIVIVPNNLVILFFTEHFHLFHWTLINSSLQSFDIVKAHVFLNQFKQSSVMGSADVTYFHK